MRQRKAQSGVIPIHDFFYYLNTKDYLTISCNTVKFKLKLSTIKIPDFTPSKHCALFVPYLVKKKNYSVLLLYSVFVASSQPNTPDYLINEYQQYKFVFLNVC